MIRVGILPTTQINEKDNPYNDIYTFSNIITKQVYRSGALPVGILLNNGKLDVNSLKMCDAFIIGGGKRIEPYFFETINYAIRNNIPLLGVCLGMQAIAVYSYLETLLNTKNKELSINNFCNEFKIIKDNNVSFLIPVEGHYNEKITRSNYAKNIHKIKVNKESILYNIYNNETLDIVSMHRYAVNKYGDAVLINCKCDDVIEGIEYLNKELFILGVQWHPEIEEKNSILFETLVKEAQKRENNILGDQ